MCISRSRGRSVGFRHILVRIICLKQHYLDSGFMDKLHVSGVVLRTYRVTEYDLPWKLDDRCLGWKRTETF